MTAQPQRTMKQEVIDLLNKVDPPGRVMLHCVPTRVIRVLSTDDSFKTFRVEQFVVTAKDPPAGNWVTLSTHGSEARGQSYSIACEAAYKAQTELKSKLQARVGNHGLLRP